MSPIDSANTNAGGSGHLPVGSEPAIGTDPTTVAAIVAASASLTPFISAFMNRLGERLGDAVSFRWIWKVVRAGTVTGGKLAVTDDTAAPPLTIVIDKDLSDDARLALIELDPTATELRGKTLIWVEQERRWRPETPSDRRR